MFNSYKVTYAWKQFGRDFRQPGGDLLKELSSFVSPILVTGCQRSGTTILTRVLSQSVGMTDFSFGLDDELAAALLLAGGKTVPREGRYCFQTTYLNNRYTEYFDQSSDFYLIWVVRNPYSVVYSMVYNWTRFALNELFGHCGKQCLTGVDKERFDKFGGLVLSRLKKACYAYVGKTNQLFELVRQLDRNPILVVDYDDLVERKSEILPRLYHDVELTYDQSYAAKINRKSVNKANNLSERQRAIIDQICLETYEQSLTLLTY